MSGPTEDATEDQGAKPTGAPTTAVGPDAKGPAAFGLCNAFAHGKGAGKAADRSVAFRNLVTAAGGEDKVEAYCASVEHPSAHSKGKPADHPQGKPTDQPKGKPSSHPTGKPSTTPGSSHQATPTDKPPHRASRNAGQAGLTRWGRVTGRRPAGLPRPPQ